MGYGFWILKLLLNIVVIVLFIFCLFIFVEYDFWLFDEERECLKFLYGIFLFNMIFVLVDFVKVDVLLLLLIWFWEIFILCLFFLVIKLVWFLLVIKLECFLFIIKLDSVFFVIMLDYLLLVIKLEYFVFFVKLILLFIDNIECVWFVRYGNLLFLC